MNTTNLIAIALACAALAACHRAPQEESASNAVPSQRGTTPAAPSQRGTAPAAVVEAPVAGNGSLAPRGVPRDAITDSVITTRVKAGILSDPGLAGSDISVNTDRGVVTLTGMVKSQEQAAVASAHAQRPDGVLRVENHLAVNLQ
jgi:osmotically-inducible protein OsmY